MMGQLLIPQGSPERA